MDAFEQIISEILWREGYWVQNSVKIELTPAEKKQLGNPSMPRPELDIVAYRGSDNSLMIVECKSYLDSSGVDFASFEVPKENDRYKLFNRTAYRQMVIRKLRSQMVEKGLCAPGVKVQLALACGKIKNQDTEKLSAYFRKQKWGLYDAHWIREKLSAFADFPYDNQVAVITAKLLMRGPR